MAGDGVPHRPRRAPSPRGALYTRMAHQVAARVIREYSTSFTAATALLGPGVRRDIRTLYAVVRIADEIVDGTAADLSATTQPVDPVALLDAYEEAILAALRAPVTTDPVLHAFGDTARRCQLRTADLRSFFQSMRRDAEGTRSYAGADLEEYVYGSAEAVGLLCLDVFLAHDGRPGERPASWEYAARRFGAALQHLNFLRDAADDAAVLGRNYLEGRPLTEATKTELLDRIDADLATARAVIPELPRQARCGVLAAATYFGDLSARLRRTSVTDLSRRRVSVPTWSKAVGAVRAVWRGSRDGRRVAS